MVSQIWAGGHAESWESGVEALGWLEDVIVQVRKKYREGSKIKS